jgi:hypothetical protein
LLTFVSADSLPMMGHQGVRVGGQDLYLGCDFPSGRVDRRLPSPPSDVRKIVSSAGRFLMWLCRRRFCSPLAESCMHMQTTTERPMFFSMACIVTWIRCRFSFGSEEDNECSRANFDEPGAHDAVFRSEFLCIAN